MADGQLDFMDMIIETHLALGRQGPGSPEMTLKALGCLGDLSDISLAADLGCGTGGPTVLLAQNLAGSVIGLDICPPFIDALNAQAQSLGLGDRLRGVVGSIDDLPFGSGSLDLIWSEGVIDTMGFAEGLAYWSSFLRPGGRVAVTCPSWLTDGRPDEIEQYWVEASGGLGTVQQNVAAMQSLGLEPLAQFTLPDGCWTDGYLTPRAAADQALIAKYPGNPEVLAYVEEDLREADLFSRYSRYYGYVFYVGRKA